ncbi:MAG: ATP-binding protein [Planctomycetes bacterium]|nr:ATP-binding protein [Planctomycetota bacterium]
MEKFFNTTGPCNPEDHYLLPPADRLMHADLSRYIKNKLYWVLHAPRQTGKTTFLQNWVREINAGYEALACYVTVEVCQSFPKAEESIPAICTVIQSSAERQLGKKLIPSTDGELSPSVQLQKTLQNWALLCAPKPLVVLFDEVDVLEDQAMVSFLRQLRGGFADRGVGKFPVSIALVGMRDLRDYLIKSKDGDPVNPGSPFNIKESSATITNFSREDVHNLMAQHVDATGQKFEKGAVDLIYDLTRGQPWLANSLAKKCHWDLCPHSEMITIQHILEAKELLIKERAVHLDSLAERLRDPRIYKIVANILSGGLDPTMATTRDFELTMDLGLVALERGTPIISNPIYREVIPRVMTWGMQCAIPEPEFKWKKNDGTLDMDALMEAFQEFWSLHSDIWEQKADYTEAFPHLLLMAFLQRVANGGARIEREYAAGRGRMDLAIQYGGEWTIIEVKLVNHLGRQKVLDQGLKQIGQYRERMAPEAAGYLVVFDRTKAGREKPWEERLIREEMTAGDGRSVVLIGG